MEYRKLGRSGLKVSSLCLGAMTFGEADEQSMMHGVSADEATSFALMDRALDAGVMFWDTADVYGQDGLSERVIGRWLAERGRRADVVLATKCRFGMGPRPNDAGASRKHVVEACEASLRRLRTDYVDLLQIHMQDPDTPEEETLRALDDLVRAGKVRYVGCSNYAAYRLVDAMWTSRQRNLEGFVSLQAQYSLVVRDLEREHVPACREHGLGLLPWSPLAGGFLTGKYREGQGIPEGSRYESDRFKAWWKGVANERGWRILRAVREVAGEVEATEAQVALAWLLRKPGVSSVIFGARTVAQLEDNLKAAELALDEGQMARLDEASALELGYPYDFLKMVTGRW